MIVILDRILDNNGKTWKTLLFYFKYVGCKFYIFKLTVPRSICNREQNKKNQNTRLTPEQEKLNFWKYIGIYFVNEDLFNKVFILNFVQQKKIVQVKHWQPLTL